MKDMILETKDLCKSFRHPGGTQTVLNKMNLQIYKGKMTAIRGKSGNGKSRSISVLLSLYSINQKCFILKTLVFS